MPSTNTTERLKLAHAVLHKWWDFDDAPSGNGVILFCRHCKQSVPAQMGEAAVVHHASCPVPLAERTVKLCNELLGLGGAGCAAL